MPILVQALAKFWGFSCAHTSKFSVLLETAIYGEGLVCKLTGKGKLAKGND
jgi:hypothetical protein